MMSALYTYPHSLSEKIENGFPHVSFTVIKRGSPSDHRRRIHMYLPTALSVSDGAKYSEVDLGLAKAAQGLRDKTVNQSDVISALIAKASGGGGLVEAAASAQQIRQGVALNPYTNMAFQGTNIRSFSFSFQMAPESSEESETIRRIENLFRKYLYPKRSGAVTIIYPPTFRIQFWKGESENKFLPKIVDSFLTGVEVSYNESTNVYHKDGAPVETKLTLNFQETKALVQSDLYNEDGDGAPSDSDYNYNTTRSLAGADADGIGYDPNSPLSFSEGQGGGGDD